MTNLSLKKQMRVALMAIIVFAAFVGGGKILGVKASGAQTACIPGTLNPPGCVWYQNLPLVAK